jgi:alpha-mannosidase
LFLNTLIRFTPTSLAGDDRRVEYKLVNQAKGGETIHLLVEMACNGMFGTGKNGLINPPQEDKTFLLAKGKAKT